MMARPRVIQLQTPVNNYPWGKIGHESLAAVVRNEQPDFIIDDNTPYAEMWMGSHIKAPAKVIHTEETDLFLDAWIKEMPEDALGKPVFNKYGANLPFLFKILSIRTALSIQAHPDKTLAEKLHHQQPNIYADPNHKPEMAVALTDFEGMCGFRPLSETLGYVQRIPELRAVIGEESFKKLEQANDSNDPEKVQVALRSFVNSLLRCDSTKIVAQLNSHQQNLQNLISKKVDTTDCLGELFLRLHEQYPGDSGCFCIYVFNYIQLKPSEALFMEANVPHAYISGDLIECMACSDNVVRAGLTPKLKDVDTLLAMLKYEPRSVSETKLQPLKEDENTWLYNVPIEEFTVRKIQIKPESVKKYVFQPVKGPSIILTLNGNATLQHSTGSIKLKKGVVLYTSSEEEMIIENITEDLLVFQAFCEI